MIKETIKYVDYNGNEREEDFYFDLNSVEILEMEATTSNGLIQKIDDIINAKDDAEIVKILKDILLKAYGRKTSDGKYFMKNEQITEEFKCSPAYPILYMELATDSQKAAEFYSGIVSENILKKNETEKHEN